MSRDVSLLHPRLRALAMRLVIECNERGLPMRVTDCFRTKAEQDTLYAQGRTQPGPVVTQVRWPNSAHCWGVAFDFCRNVPGREYDDRDGLFRAVAEIAKGYGLEWGGDWTRFQDKPHLQLREFMPGNSTAWLKQRYGSPEAFRATWKEEVDEMERWEKLDDVPAGYYRQQVERLMLIGVIRGKADGTLDLTEDMLRTLLMAERIGKQ